MLLFVLIAAQRFDVGGKNVYFKNAVRIEVGGLQLFISTQVTTGFPRSASSLIHHTIDWLLQQGGSGRMPRIYREPRKVRPSYTPYFVAGVFFFVILSIGAILYLIFE